jgi:hypothetical protein
MLHTSDTPIRCAKSFHIKLLKLEFFVSYKQGACYNLGMTTAVLKRNITKMARESVHSALRAEMMHLRASMLPTVSASEQSEIVKKYKKPSHEIVRSAHSSF